MGSAKKLLIAMIACVGSFAYGSQCYAFCREPSAPSFMESEPSEPTTPFCVNTYSKTHTCSEWVIDSYNRDVESYNQDIRRYRSAVKTYIDQLNEYLDEAYRYAECEARRLR